MTEPASYPKRAACLCGGLSVTVSAPPRFAHACSCLDCQRRSGSAFSYSAFFDEPVTKIEGEPKVWRRLSDAGRWHEANFCPVCGVTVFIRMQAAPEMLCVPVGSFSDASFPAPARLYWTSRRHHWLELPHGIERVDTQ
jgi:hypothetical protein